MSDKLVSHLLNDFIDVFSIYFPNKNREYVINYLNGGCCGMAAMLVGNTLITKYGYNPETTKWNSHCLHMWLNVNGVDYDTLYPEGYPDDVSVHWMLDIIGYSDNIMKGDIDINGNSGYMQLHIWEGYFLIKTWCERYGLPYPDYLNETKHKLHKHSTNKSVRRYRRLRARYKKAKSLELPDLSKEVVTNDTLPTTHYFYGEFEEGENRELAPYPFMIPIAVMKRLMKDHREAGISIKRL